jgi:hypothetical protein
MHGFQNTFQPMQHADGRQNLRGIRPLGPTGFDPAARYRLARHRCRGPRVVLPLWGLSSVFLTTKTTLCSVLQK